MVLLNTNRADYWVARSSRAMTVVGRDVNNITLTMAALLSAGMNVILNPNHPS